MILDPFGSTIDTASSVVSLVFPLKVSIRSDFVAMDVLVEQDVVHDLGVAESPTDQSGMHHFSFL